MLHLPMCIARLPMELQLLIDEYYNERRIYYSKYVLPNMSFINRITNHYSSINQFVFLHIDNILYKQYYLINIYKLLNTFKLPYEYNFYNNEIITENEFIMADVINLNNSVVNTNVWIRLYLTEQGNGTYLNTVVTVLYINKYNYNIFAIKIYGDNTDKQIFIIQPSLYVTMTNHCYFYNSRYKEHLPVKL